MNKFVLVLFFISFTSFAGTNISAPSSNEINIISQEENVGELSDQHFSYFNVPVISIHELFTKIIDSSYYGKWDVLIPEDLNKWAQNNSIYNKINEKKELSFNMFAHSLTSQPVLISNQFESFFSDLNQFKFLKKNNLVIIKYAFFPRSVGIKSEQPLFFYLIQNLSDSLFNNAQLNPSFFNVPLNKIQQDQWIEDYESYYEFYHDIMTLISNDQWQFAFELLSEMSSNTIPELQFIFAKQLIEGLGCQKNISEGIKFLILAMRQGHASSLLYSLSLSMKHPEIKLLINEQINSIVDVTEGFQLRELPLEILEKIIKELDSDSILNLKLSSRNNSQAVKNLYPVKNFGFSPILQLPNELQNKILNFLDASSVKNLKSSVSQHYKMVKDLRSYKIIKIPHSNPDSIAYSFDLKKIALLSPGKLIRVFDTFDKEKKYPALRGHISEIQKLTFLPDNETLVTVDSDSILKIWDTETGKCLQTLTGPKSLISKINFSEDGSILLASSFDQTTQVWNVASGNMLSKFNIKDGGYAALAPSGQIAALFSPSEYSNHSKIINIWGTHTGQKVQMLEGSFNQDYSVSFSPDSSKIIAVNNNFIVEIWDVTTGKLLKQFNRMAFQIQSASFLPDGKSIAIIGRKGECEIYHLDTMALLFKINNQDFGREHNFSFSSDSKKIITYEYGQSFADVWDIESNRLVTKLDAFDLGVYSASFSHNGNKAITFSINEFKIWNLLSLK